MSDLVTVKGVGRGACKPLLEDAAHLFGVAVRYPFWSNLRTSSVHFVLRGPAEQVQAFREWVLDKSAKSRRNDA